MIRQEIAVIVSLALIGISWESPFSQYHNPYPLDHVPYASAHRSYGSSRSHHDSDSRYDNGHDLVRSESRHVTRRHGTHHESLPHMPEYNSRLDHSDQSDAMRNKRQAFLPYFPYYAYMPPAPFYQVHNIILTPPSYNCFPPRPSYDRPPMKRPDETTQAPDDGLGLRVGSGDSKNGTDSSVKQPPSKCVWSIVACCSPGSRDIRYACFELLGCPGAFWDVNPCDERVVTAAANAALRYYMNNQAPTPEPTFQNL